MATIRLGEIATARSGDKGSGANIGVIARTEKAFGFLQANLTAARVRNFFESLSPDNVVRFELPNLLALNFVLPAILDGGGSVSLRVDAQGKALGQALLEMELPVSNAMRDELLGPVATSEQSSTTSALIELSSLENDIAVITLNRPEKRNALSMAMIEQLTAAVHHESNNPERRVVILPGNGPAFCAGLDLQETAEAHGSGAAAGALSHLYCEMISSRLIFVAAAHGVAVGGGVGLLAACDLVVASNDFRIGLPEVRRGLVPALVLCLLARQVSDRRLREMVLLGEMISARRAKHFGLINRVVEPNQLVETATQLAREVCKGAPGATESTKKLLNTLGGIDIHGELARVLAYHRNEGNSDAAEGMAAFLEKRPPNWNKR